MALNLISGKSYSLENGLSEQSSTWMVVGKAIIPIKVDKTLGWRDTNLNKPNFSTCLSYICLPFDLTSGVLSDKSFFIPSFAVESIISTGDETVPVIIEGRSYTSNYELSDNVEIFSVQTIGLQPLRIDDKLTWRKPLINEEPTFISVDACVAYNVSGPPWVPVSSTVTQVPLFSVTRVIEWKSITENSEDNNSRDNSSIDSTVQIGFQRFQDIQENIGPQGVKKNIELQSIQENIEPQWNIGPQGVQGNIGPQGYQGVSGPFFIQYVQEVNSPVYYANIFNAYYGIIYTSGITYFYLPSISSTVHNGKIITVTDETGTISDSGRGIIIIGNSGETINGKTSILMKIDNMSLTFIARNGKWFIYSSYIPTV